MKAKVTSRFRDKDTLIAYPLNSVYECNDEKRVKELQGLGFLGKLEEEPKEEPKKKQVEQEKVKEDNPKKDPKEKKTSSKKGR